MHSCHATAMGRWARSTILLSGAGITPSSGARFKDGKHLSTENHIFKIEVDKSDERIQSIADALQDAEETLEKLYGACGAYCDDRIDGYRERKKERAVAWSNG